MSRDIVYWLTIATRSPMSRDESTSIRSTSNFSEKRAARVIIEISRISPSHIPSLKEEKRNVLSKNADKNMSNRFHAQKLYFEKGDRQILDR